MNNKHFFHMLICDRKDRIKYLSEASIQKLESYPYIAIVVTPDGRVDEATPLAEFANRMGVELPKDKNGYLIPMIKLSEEQINQLYIKCNERIPEWQEEQRQISLERDYWEHKAIAIALQNQTKVQLAIALKQGLLTQEEAGQLTKVEIPDVRQLT